MRTEILGLGWALALGFMGGPGRAQGLAAPPGVHAPAKPCDTCIPGVENAAQVSESLWRGAQPTAEGFRALAQRGVKTIVSFRHDHDDLPLLKGTGLKYLRIPSRAFRPTEANLVAFLKIMADPANGPVFIHCA